MSKIYRRPMFRGGGKVSSYGNGIATGLADGGRVNLFAGGPPNLSSLYGKNFGGATSNPIGGNTVTSNPMKTGTSIVETALNNAKTNTSKIKSGLGNIKTNIGKMDFSEKGIGQAFKKLPALGDKLAGYGTNLIKRFPAISYGLAGEYVTRPQDVDKLIYEQEGYGPIEGRIRQVLDPTYNSKMMDIYKQGYDEDGKLNALLKEQTEKKEDADVASTGKETTVDINTAEPVLSKKERLEKAAKEYEDILGAGIKKDSIFDAMIAGGTSLMAGEGYASAIRQANKELDPIQNIKTASRKLALEEDIAMRKALATAAGKETETSRKIAAMKAGGFSKEQIANAVAGIKTKSIAEEAKDANSKTEGYRNWHIKNVPDVKVTEFTEVKDIEKAAENLPDGVYYVTFPGDTYVKIEGNKVVAKKRRGG